MDHVFAYGTLTGELFQKGIGTVATLRGGRREWGVALDNEQAIPGYKQYRLRSDGSTPRVFVAFLGMVEDPGCAMNGVVAPIDEATLAQLDVRERNYDRVDVTARIDDPPEGRVWTYVPSKEGRARRDTGLREGRLVVQRDYVDEVHAAFRLLGDAEYARFLASSTIDDVTVLDLERVDLALGDSTR